jgi:hypothetical protein
MHRKAEEETAHGSATGDAGNAARRPLAAAQQAKDRQGAPDRALKV